MMRAASRFQPIQTEDPSTFTWQELRSPGTLQSVQPGTQQAGVPRFVLASRRLATARGRAWDAVEAWAAANRADEQVLPDVNVAGTNDERPAAASDTVLRTPAPPPPTSKFLVLQWFEGQVQSVEKDEFVAVLRDKTDPSYREEEATFPLDEVADDDLPLVAPGAVFYWHIGHEVTLAGSKKRVSNLRFRRLPAWTASEIAAIKRESKELEELFGVS